MQCIEGQGMWKKCASINYVKCSLLSSSSTKHLQAPCLVARFNDMHPCTLWVLLTSLFSPFFPSFLSMTPFPLPFPTQYSQDQTSRVQLKYSLFRETSSLFPQGGSRTFSSELVWHFICSTLVAGINNLPH